MTESNLYAFSSSAQTRAFCLETRSTHGLGKYFKRFWSDEFSGARGEEEERQIQYRRGVNKAFPLLSSVGRGGMRGDECLASTMCTKRASIY